MLLPPPEYEDEPEPIEKEVISDERKRHFERFLTAISWTCGRCGLTNHGWNERCADWRCKAPRA
jgi:hypothetical protein